MLRPRVLIPFIVATIIWGTTWIVIRDQLGPVPPTWSVTYRFAAGSVAMFVMVRAPSFGGLQAAPVHVVLGSDGKDVNVSYRLEPVEVTEPLFMGEP